MDSSLQEFLTTRHNALYLHSEESTMSNSLRYYLPNTLKNWKWPRRLNPHYLEVKADSAVWARRFEAMSNTKAQYVYDQSNIRTN